MAGCSFADDVVFFTSWPIDLDEVNAQLQWNPNPRDRETTPPWWNADTESDSAQLTNVISPAVAGQFGKSHEQFERRRALEADVLKYAKRNAECCANPLAYCHEGRLLLLDTKNSSASVRYSDNPKYWLARADFFTVEAERLGAEDKKRGSSLTPQTPHFDTFDDTTEQGQARYRAWYLADALATVPAGRAFLAAEDAAEDDGDSATNPDYWRRKQNGYQTAYDGLQKKSPHERAKGHADREAELLATFLAGQALLDAEDHDDPATSIQYWQPKANFYSNKRYMLEKEFWRHWKLTCLYRVLGVHIPGP